MNQYKTCTKCGQAQLLPSFNNDKTRKDGLFPHCKICVRADAKKRYAGNPEHFKEKTRGYALAHPEMVKRNRAKWLENNLEKNREYQRVWAGEYRKQNPLNHRRWKTDPKKLAEWRRENPDKTRKQKHERRVRELGARSYSVTSKDMAKLMAGSCIYCGSRELIQIDHVFPLARGGTHSVGNLAPACRTCNVRKSSKFVMEWKLHEMKAKRRKL
jgi:5-methylcytosine-specific restriction endonuclease McrA